MGRNALDQKTKDLTGTARADRQRTGLPEYSRLAAIPDPPPTLDEYGSGIWCLLAQELIDAKMLMLTDLFALEVLVNAVQEYREACKKVQGRPKVIIGPSHKPTTNPWLKIRDKAAERIKAGVSQFGFSPLARLKLTAPSTDDTPDPLAAFLFGSSEVIKSK